MIKLFFSSQKQDSKVATLLLVARVVFAILLATHGCQKLEGFEQMSSVFPDPLGVGSTVSLSLAIFAELFCSIAVIVGLLTRLALIPMAFTMIVAFGSTHGWSISNGGELAFVYLVVFVLLIFAGPGKYSIDGFIGKKLGK